MRRLLALLLVLGAPHVAAAGVLDPGLATLEGATTDLVERRLRVDLWDAGEAPRAYLLRAAPDSDALPGVEVRARPALGAEGAWKQLPLRIVAGEDKRALDRGWDGVWEVALRVRLPSEASTRLALLLVEEQPGVGGVAITTTLRARPVTIEATAAPEGAGWSVTARVVGKEPSAVEAVEGAQRWSLERTADAWRAALPRDVQDVALSVRFADGAVLEGPTLTSPLAADTPMAEPEAAAAPARTAPTRSRASLTSPAAPATPATAASPLGAPAEPAARPVPALPISLLLVVLMLVSLGKPRRPPSL